MKNVQNKKLSLVLAIAQNNQDIVIYISIGLYGKLVGIPALYLGYTGFTSCVADLLY
jgi:hypothetical protein